ncbi:Odorant receptor 67d [Lucilia cuprina]|nr:Odorant receptor 67d [Lucilia cuprina]
MAKNCSDRYTNLIKVLTRIAAICGANIFLPNFRIYWLTWITLCLMGGAVQGYFSKLLGALFHRPAMVSMNQTLFNIYKQYEQENEFLKVLSYRINLASKILKLVLCIYLGTLPIIVLYPLIYGLLYGEKLFVMQFLLPGIDSSTHIGYIIHNVVHVFLMCLGGFGNFAGDMYIFTLIIHIPLLKDILKIKFEKLNQVALTNSKKSMSLLKDIVEWHQKCLFIIREFVKQVEQSYYGVIFVQIFTSVMSICCTIFCIITSSWPAAFSYLLYSAIFLYVYCGLGHLVEISNEDVMDVIYGDCLWYELTIPEQKLVLLMLRKSQRPTTLTIGQIMPLSMSTALQLTKAIYSYMMMLLNFLESDDFLTLRTL